jgi:glutathione S-transferase
MRARMALALSGTAVELREVLLRDKPPSLREVSPKATVPVLITDEQQVLEESLDIMLWTLQDQQECFALGEGAAAQREFIESFDQHFKPLLDQYKYHRTGTEPPASYYRDQCADWLQRLDAMLQTQPYLLGEQPQLLDMALLPFVRQFAHVDLTWFEQAPYPRLRQWLSDWLQHELFTSVMSKYQPWQEGTPGIAWSPMLHSHSN